SGFAGQDVALSVRLSNPVDGNTASILLQAFLIAKLESANRPPIANAGTDRTVEAISPGGARVTLDGSTSSDPDGDPLTYTWTGPFGTVSGPKPMVTLPLGTNMITLTVSDGIGGIATATVTISVVD